MLRGAVSASEPSTAEPSAELSLLSADLVETPRTDAGGSEGASVATTAGSVAEERTRFKPKWTTQLDVETRRIAQIMRGSRAKDGEAVPGAGIEAVPRRQLDSRLLGASARLWRQKEASSEDDESCYSSSSLGCSADGSG